MLCIAGSRPRSSLIHWAIPESLSFVIRKDTVDANTKNTQAPARSIRSSERPVEMLSKAENHRCTKEPALAGADEEGLFIESLCISRKQIGR